MKAIVILIAVILSPIFTITALNTLFATGISLTVGTWFAAFWVNWLLVARNVKSGEG